MRIRKRRATQQHVRIHIPALDYQTAFQFVPVGMMMSHERVMLDVDDEVIRISGHPRMTMMGQSFELLYPMHDEYERTGVCIIPVMSARGSYSDERIMKRANGELFWYHVTGRMLGHAKPLGGGIWTFGDLSAHRLVIAVLTSCERDIATQLVEGKTSKQIGKQLEISPRTVEIYRARLMKKYAANTSLELVRWPIGY